jgi:hypothetical protein
MSYVSPASSLMEQPKQKEAQPKIDSSNTDFTKTKDFKKSFMKKKTMVPFKFGKKHFMDDAEVNSKGNRKFSSKRGPKGNGLSLNNEEDNFNSKISSNRSKLRNNDENNSEFKRRANKRTKTTKIVFDLNKLKNNLIEKSKQKEKEENEKKLMEEKKKNKKCMFFTNIIKNELEEPNIDEINWYYFNKYHSVSLAKKATEKKVMEFLKEKKMRLKTSSKTNKNKNKIILPDINKNKNKGKDNKKELKKPQSLNRLGPKQLLDSFGFRRRAYKTRFLY